MADESSTATAIGQLEPLVQTVALADVIYEHVAAHRGSWSGDDLGTEIQLELRDSIADEGVLDVRMTLQLRAEDAEYKIAVIGRFRSEKNLEVEADTMREFVENVATFTLFPYVREPVMELAGRIRVRVPLLDFLRQGVLKMNSGPPGVLSVH